MFEVGKTYKTRDGRDARVVDVWPEKESEFRVAARVGSRWETYTLEGCLRSKDHPMSGDLVLPPTVMYANIYPGGVGSLHSSKQVADAVWTPSALRIAVPVEVPNP